MTAAYVAGLVVAFCLGGLLVGFWQWRRDRAELLDMDAVVADLRHEITTLNTLLFGPDTAESEAG